MPIHLCFQEGDEPGMEDAKEVVPGKAYHWRDWCVARGRDCLYIWSDAAALELSNGSNGWFRFILDGKLATMYSSGSPEGGSESTGTRMNADSEGWMVYCRCCLYLFVLLLGILDLHNPKFCQKHLCISPEVRH